ncbi:metal-dependent hydrolase [Crocosphaera sp. UHCC 0190]|uniref:metal-dependent hydrolase n=1 Tax=Crocosphaera sp. UHCC 0190 TaxID=3110246 RepID=UPI002B1EF9CB|nr:metal-dependent hydrolase [Crocosphaera sp. UHCC 0190]MEA5511827.1 metal-dependent hydrolase [Crocosphaera sp. UHCC 0190]
MMTPTHIAFSVSLTSIVLGTANLELLGVAALASLLPDIDTSKSFIGRLLFPISSWLEANTVHRGITHSFFATGVLTLVSYPLVLYGYPQVWHGLILGYFFGWFGDVFTKSGVEAFYPSHGRLIIPRNPRLRLATRSNGEWFLLMVLVAIAIISININSAGGIIRSFNQALGIPSGAIETVKAESSLYLLNVNVKGRNTLTEQPINQSYEVIEPLTASDLLVKDDQGMTYSIGNSQSSQIQANQIKVERISAIKTEIINLTFDEEEIYPILAQLPSERTYLTGTLTIHDAEDLMIPSHVETFDTITLQPGDVAYARLTSASPIEVMRLLGDYYVSGSLIVRIINVN